MANRLVLPFILPIHYNLPCVEDDSHELTKHVHAAELEVKGWYAFHEKKKEKQT